MKKILAVAVLALLATQASRAQQTVSEGAASPAVRLTPTAHAALPGHPSQYWLVPDPGTVVVTSRAAQTALTNLARATDFIAETQYSSALPLIDPQTIAATPLGAYGYYYQGVAYSGLQRYPEADAAFSAAAALKPEGALAELLPLRQADVAMARGDLKRATETLEPLEPEKAMDPVTVLLQRGRTAERAGDAAGALKFYRKLYYDYPTSAESADAQAGIERLQTPDLIPENRFKLELARAEKLFAAKRWAQSRAGFDALRRAAQGDDADLLDLRVAECDYYLDRFRSAREQLQSRLKGSREAEARFFHLTATRAAGDQDTYLTLARKFVADFPESPWAEETLNNLASHYIIVDQDDEADLVFRELARRFPKSRYTERAAWKIGWRAYRTGDFREAAETFEKAAATFPRSDYRPSWIYWAGRSRDQVGEPEVAAARYRLAIADYANSYYGRLATAVLSQRGPSVANGAGQSMAIDRVAMDRVAIDTVTTTTIGAAPQVLPTDTLIRELGRLQMYETALREVSYAQHAWGTSPQLEATIAWIRHNQGLGLSGTERFNALRGAINTMRRAYPQFMAAGGEQLPPEILRVIFPLDFWPMITRGSMQQGLDPFLIAALMAQESTFTPEIKSAANAVGLMQLMPATGKRYATKVGMKRFSVSQLTDPEVNIRLGMQYFKDLTDRFGGAYYAIASYNAGENRVAQWRAKNPDLSEDEFIDDIPFPETQNYVKRILGTAEDYRRLYGSGLLDPNMPLSPGSPSPKRVAPRSVKASTTTKKSTSTKKPTTPTKKKAATPKKKTTRR